MDDVWGYEAAPVSMPVKISTCPSTVADFIDPPYTEDLRSTIHKIATIEERDVPREMLSIKKRISETRTSPKHGDCPVCKITTAAKRIPEYKEMMNVLTENAGMKDEMSIYKEMSDRWNVIVKKLANIKETAVPISHLDFYMHFSPYILGRHKPIIKLERQFIYDRLRAITDEIEKTSVFLDRGGVDKAGLDCFLKANTAMERALDKLEQCEEPEPKGTKKSCSTSRATLTKNIGIDSHFFSPPTNPADS